MILGYGRQAPTINKGIVNNMMGFIGYKTKKDLKAGIGTELVKQTAIKASMNMMKSYIRDYEMGQVSIGKFLDLVEAKIELIAKY